MSGSKTSTYQELPGVSEVRIPLLMAFLIGAAGVQFLGLAAPWALLIVGVAEAGIALFRRRTLIAALLRRYRTPSVIVAPVLVFFLVGVVDLLLQSATASVLVSGRLHGPLPFWLEGLVSLRSSFGAMGWRTAGGVLLVVAVSEELFWRGYVLTSLMPQLGHGLAILATTALYGLYYFLVMGAAGAVLALLFSFLFALSTVRSKSLLPAVLGHMLLFVLLFFWRPEFGM